MVNHISAASTKVRDAYELIEEFTRQAMKTCVCIRGDSYYIREAPFAMLHKTIQGYVEVVKENARNAKLSEDNAKISENNARTSENNAKTSETNSKASETSAASSATNAANSAFAASTSETNAANSASSAAGSASAASTSESNAAASADNAEESANMAKMYAQQAKDTDISNLINQLAGYKITTKMEDSDGNYVTDANGDYIETVVLLANPDDLLSILERVVALEKAVYEK